MQPTTDCFVRKKAHAHIENQIQKQTRAFAHDPRKALGMEIEDPPEHDPREALGMEIEDPPEHDPREALGMEIEDPPEHDPRGHARRGLGMEIEETAEHCPWAHTTDCIRADPARARKLASSLHLTRRWALASETEKNVARILEHDMHAARNEWLLTPPKAIQGVLRALLWDERDMPIAFVFVNVLLLTLPAAVAVFSAQSHALGCLYLLANTALMQERFTLALHYSAHRRLTRSRVLNALPSYVLGPLFGIPPGMYHLHHIVMHHNEQNVFPWDISSTEKYQRDSILHFVLYWLRFLLAAWVELPAYAFLRGRGLLGAQCLCTITASTLLYKHAWRCYPVGTLWVLLLPALLGSLLLMFGNWCQHIFIDGSGDTTPYSYTYNAVCTPHNQTSFNDGYHVEHHLNSRLHWSEFPVQLAKRLHLYKRHDALIFQGLGFMRIGLLAMRGDYDTLARHVVPLHHPPHPLSHYSAMLRSRVRPVTHPRPAFTRSL